MTPRAGSPEPDDPPAPRNVAEDVEATGLPGLRTWRGVYWVVMGCFVFWVALLYSLGAVFK